VRLTALVLSASVKARAAALGFARTGIGPADPPEHGAAFQAWLDAGYAGTMSYLARGRADRLDPQRLLPGARSVVAVALSHGDGREDDPSWSPVARYARGRDYHEVMRPRLERLAGFLREAAGDGTATRVAVDTSAVLERDLAARAGLGWMGKNTNLLSPGLGSYFLIGIVLTTAVLEPDAPVADRCGTCTACLEACPTRAFVAPYILDARRCISYLTIEHRGEIPEDLRGALHGWVFGCDVCQEVCPWNLSPLTGSTRDSAWQARPGLDGPKLLDLWRRSDDELRTLLKGSAMKRAGVRRLRRNLAVAIGNTGDRAAVEALTNVSEPTCGDPLVAEHVSWAVEKLGG
jgi:epoxyqueuosine reductase